MLKTVHVSFSQPQALSDMGRPTGEHCSQHNLAADVCPRTICTNVQLNSPLCPKPSGRFLREECEYINTLVQTLIKPALN